LILSELYRMKKILSVVFTLSLLIYFFLNENENEKLNSLTLNKVGVQQNARENLSILAEIKSSSESNSNKYLTCLCI